MTFRNSELLVAPLLSLASHFGMTRRAVLPPAGLCWSSSEPPYLAAVATTICSLGSTSDPSGSGAPPPLIATTQ